MDGYTFLLYERAHVFGQDAPNYPFFEVDIKLFIKVLEGIS
jgi:hypothetical protein